VATECVFESEGVSMFGDSVLTVGQLRKLLASVPDEVHVVIATDGWYDNVSCVAIPDENGEHYVAVTLYHGETFDARQ
jgi:uncharacterized protein with GYD domain